MLNHEEENIRFMARNSLELDARDLMEAGSLTENFLGIIQSGNYVFKSSVYQEMNVLTELKMQGTLVNLPFLDYLLPQDIFKAVLFPDKLTSFCHKMRHNVCT